jgi:hypothetical protein
VASRGRGEGAFKQENGTGFRPRRLDCPQPLLEDRTIEALEGEGENNRRPLSLVE